jgi:CHAD domain-containing protein
MRLPALPIPLDPWLEHLRLHLPVAERGDDPEGVHQVRVATRRLDVWLELRGMRVLRDDLAWLRRRNGLVRDLDVQLLARPPGAFVRWLRSRRRAARAALLEAMRERRLEGLLLALSLLGPLDPPRAQEGMTEVVRRLRRLDQALERTPDDLEALHRVRRQLRRLRYAREWVGAKTKVFEELQDTFGAVGVLSVALRLAEAGPATPAMAAHTAKLGSELEAVRQTALARWRDVRRRVMTVR